MHKNSDYFLTDFHRQIEEELIKIVFKLSGTNLIICMPPRFGKSELRIFLSWCFIFIPDCNFIVASNGFGAFARKSRSRRPHGGLREAFPCAANRNGGITTRSQNSRYFVSSLWTPPQKRAQLTTSLQLWGDGAGKNAYLLDMFVKRMEFPELISRTESFFKMHDSFINNKRPRGIYIEDKSSGTALAQVLKQKGIPVTFWNTPKNKFDRVLISIKYIAERRVFLPRNKPFVDGFVRQCAAFGTDASAHDDMVDAMTMAIMIWSGRSK